MSFFPSSWPQSAVSFLPGGRILACGAPHQTTAEIWDVRTQRAWRPPLPGHQHEVSNLAFTSDGGLISVSHDGEIYRWGLKPDVIPRRLPGFDHDKWWPEGEYCLSTDGRSIARASMSTKVWRTADGNALWEEAPSHRNPSSTPHVAFVADNTALVRIDNTGVVDRWDAAAGRHQMEFRGIKNIGATGLSPDGRILVGVPHKWPPQGVVKIQVWDLLRGRRLRQFAVPATQNGPVLSPDGRRMLLTDASGKLVMWDLGTGKHLYEVAGPSEPWGPRCFSADGQWLASASGSPYTERGRIELRDARTGKLVRHWSGHQGDIRCLAFTEDGKYLASGGSDTCVLIWDTTGKGRDGPASPLPPKALDQLWTDLASEDADRAAVAVERLANNPAAALRLLRDRFKPLVHANWPMVTRWIADLDAGSFAVRERATRELRSRIEVLAPTLRQLLAGSLSLEARRRVEELLKWTARWTPEQLRAARATQVLEAIGDADAKAILRAVAGGALQAQPTLETKAALQRLNRDNR